MKLSFVHILLKLKEKSSKFEEDFYAIELSGNYYEAVWIDFKNLIICESFIILKINNEIISFYDIKSYSVLTEFEWNIEFNKREFFYNTQVDNFNINFFLEDKYLIEFYNNLNPFNKTAPINKVSNFNIFVAGFKGFIKGEVFNIVPIDYEIGKIENLTNRYQTFKSIDEIKEHVNFITSEDIIFQPQKFLLNDSSQNSYLCSIIMNLFSKIISIAFVDEFHSSSKVVINGIKRIEAKIIEPYNLSNKLFQDRLLELYRWLYDERTQTKKRLFSERISLEFEEDSNIIDILYKHLSDIFYHIKGQYNFVILDRKDDYFKELRELLSDLKKQSDLYSEKIRSLLNGLLRDILASFILTGFTIFAKFKDGIIYNNLTVPMLFKGLAIYYILSLLLQSLVNLQDIATSKKEIFYWKDLTRNYIPKEEFDKQVKEVLAYRRFDLRYLYALIVLIYFGIAFIAWFFEDILKILINNSA